MTMKCSRCQQAEAVYGVRFQGAEIQDHTRKKLGRTPGGTRYLCSTCALEEDAATPYTVGSARKL